MASSLARPPALRDHVRIALCQTSKFGWIEPRIHAG
jgi:hypothetical protein